MQNRKKKFFLICFKIVSVNNCTTSQVSYRDKRQTLSERFCNQLQACSEKLPHSLKTKSLIKNTLFRFAFLFHRKRGVLRFLTLVGCRNNLNSKKIVISKKEKVSLLKDEKLQVAQYDLPNMRQNCCLVKNLLQK